MKVLHSYMLNMQFTPFPDLYTPRLHLRRLTPDDANEIFFLRTDKEVQRYIDRPKPQSLDETIKYINDINALLDNNESILWGISFGTDPTVIGYICLFHVEIENCRCEVGYLLHTDQHKKGLMKEALAAVLAYGFDIMQLHSIVASINPGNVASIALLRRVGFTQEAYFKENFFYNGKFLDTAIFTIFNSSHSSNNQ